MNGSACPIALLDSLILDRTAKRSLPRQLCLETAHRKFDEACRQTASHGERMPTTIFGAAPVEDYVRFMELHTRHHGKHMADS